MRVYQGISLYTGNHIIIKTRDGVITQVESAGDAPPAGVPWLCRGFVDIQVNGYRGVDYSGQGLTRQGIRALVDDLARAGTLRHLPTLITGSHERTLNNLAIIRQAAEEDPVIAAAIPGVHLEGPYLSPLEGARGAHDPAHIRDPDIGELRAFQQAAGGLIRLVTLAPEKPGAIPFIREAVGMGIRVAMGHCLPEPRQLDAAVQAGATLSTHLGNGSPASLPRLQNHIWQQLARDELYASIIADGHHLPDAVLKTFWRTKGADRLILISDVAFLGGMPPGPNHWGDMAVEVHPDGKLSLAGTSYLAGAGHLQIRGLSVLPRAAGCALKDCLPLVYDNPLQFLGMQGEQGDFRPGEPLDLLCLRQREEGLSVQAAALGRQRWQTQDR